MRKEISSITILLAILIFFGCSNESTNFAKENISLVNRDLVSLNDNIVTLNDKPGEGLVILQQIAFDNGTIELDIKGENNPGKSFVGLAFNIQNDSTLEAIYFRPFNFQAEEKIRREHSVQYVFHPKNPWRYLRTNFEGQYEAEFPRQPSPNDWFSVRITIDDKKVKVYDKESKTELLAIERLSEQMSDKIALWVGHNSKGEFRNLKIRE